MRFKIIAATSLFIASSIPALANFAGQELPDLEGLGSVFGDVSSGKIDIEPTQTGGLISSGIPVPDTGARGNMARAIAKPLGDAVNDPNVASTFEKAFVDGVVAVEDALPGMGFEKRDYGVGFALFFLMTWELANGVELEEQTSLAAARKLISTVKAAHQNKNEATTADQLDRTYDMFLTVPISILAMVQAYEQKGLNAEASKMREFAGQAFEQVVGRSPYDISVKPDGSIVGYN